LPTILSIEHAVFIASGALAPDKTDVSLIKILPVKPIEIASEEKGLEVKEVQQSSITRDIKTDEISVRKYLNATERTGSTTLMALKNGVPLLSYWQVGKGTVFYMGFNDELGNLLQDSGTETNISNETNSSNQMNSSIEMNSGSGTWNNFHNLPEYPVFWIKFVQWIGGTGDISEYNLKTGTLTALPKTGEIRTPTKTFTSNRVIFDEAGIYEIAGKKIATNLYSDKESDTRVDASELIRKAVADDKPKVVKADTYTAKKEITDYLIVIMFLLLLLEILIVRQRGEL